MPTPTTTTLTDGLKVQIYWNLHKHCYSVMALKGPDKGRVIAHVNNFRLNNVQFIVRPAGRERARNTGTKNVHAFIKGTWTREVVPSTNSKITYNPFKYDTFVNESHGAVSVRTASRVLGCTVQSVPHLLAWCAA